MSHLKLMSRLAGLSPTDLEAVAHEYGVDPDTTDHSRGQLIDAILTAKEHQDAG